MQLNLKIRVWWDIMRHYKLLVALWKYINAGVVIEGAVIKTT